MELERRERNESEMKARRETVNVHDDVGPINPNPDVLSTGIYMNVEGGLTTTAMAQSAGVIVMEPEPIEAGVVYPHEHERGRMASMNDALGEFGKGPQHPHPHPHPVRFQSPIQLTSPPSLPPPQLPKSISDRLEPTLTHARLSLESYRRTSSLTSISLNIAIGLQILLGSLITVIAASLPRSKAHAAQISTSILGGASTVVASYLARARGSGEPELSRERMRILEKFIRACESTMLDWGHEIPTIDTTKTLQEHHTPSPPSSMHSTHSRTPLNPPPPPPPPPTQQHPRRARTYTYSRHHTITQVLGESHPSDPRYPHFQDRHETIDHHQPSFSPPDQTAAAVAVATHPRPRGHTRTRRHTITQVLDSAHPPHATEPPESQTKSQSQFQDQPEDQPTPTPAPAPQIHYLTLPFILPPPTAPTYVETKHTLLLHRVDLLRAEYSTLQSTWSANPTFSLTSILSKIRIIILKEIAKTIPKISRAIGLDVGQKLEDLSDDLGVDLRKVDVGGDVEIDVVEFGQGLRKGVGDATGVDADDVAKVGIQGVKNLDFGAVKRGLKKVDVGKVKELAGKIDVGMVKEGLGKVRGILGGRRASSASVGAASTGAGQSGVQSPTRGRSGIWKIFEKIVKDGVGTYKNEAQKNTDAEAADADARAAVGQVDVPPSVPTQIEETSSYPAETSMSATMRTIPGSTRVSVPAPAPIPVPLPILPMFIFPSTEPASSSQMPTPMPMPSPDTPQIEETISPPIEILSPPSVEMEISMPEPEPTEDVPISMPTPVPSTIPNPTYDTQPSPIPAPALSPIPESDPTSPPSSEPLTTIAVESFEEEEHT